MVCIQVNALFSNDYIIQDIWNIYLRFSEKSRPLVANNLEMSEADLRFSTIRKL